MTVYRSAGAQPERTTRHVHGPLWPVQAIVLAAAHALPVLEGSCDRDERRISAGAPRAAQMDDEKDTALSLFLQSFSATF